MSYSIMDRNRESVAETDLLYQKAGRRARAESVSQVRKAPKEKWEKVEKSA